MRKPPRYSVNAIDAARLALVQTLADQSLVLLDRIDVRRVRKAVRAAIEAYEEVTFAEARANWKRRG